MRANGVLKVSNGVNVCVVVGGPGVAGTTTGSTWPSYYSHEDGDFSTTGDMVIGTNALSGQAFFSKGNLNVGGSLRVGAQTAGLSEFKINGAGSGVSSLGVNKLEVGSRGKVTFDFLNGAAILPISVTNQVTLNSGSTLSITNLPPQAGTYTLIDGGSLSGTFTTTSISGLPVHMTAEIQYDTANGDVNLVIGDSITEFDNNQGNGDGFWSTQANWYPFYPDGTSFGRLLTTVQVDSQVQIGYLEVGTSQFNAGLNLWNSTGSLTLNRPLVSLIVGAANNGGGGTNNPGGIGYPNYYSHAAGSLTTVGDMILGANSGKVEASFSSGSIQVGGTLRLGSYQNSGASVFELRGGGGAIGAHDLEIGSAGKLAFDYLGGASLKTINVTGQASILSGAKLVIQNTSTNRAVINPTTYTLVQASSIVGAFSQVDFSGFPSSVVPRIAYSGGQIQLVIESASAVPVLDSGTYRLSGYSLVAPLGAAGYSFGSAADGEDVYYSDFSAGTITRVSGGNSTVLISGLNGIYGLAVKGTKMYFGREYDSNLGTAKIFEMTKSGSTWGTPRQVLTGITRPRQIFIESAGTLLLAVETGQILRINPVTGISTTLATGLYAPQAAVSDASGNLYFNEYGSTTADGTPTLSGKLWKMAAGTTTKTKLLEGRRLRGLALVSGSPDQLIQLSEANNEDQGSSSTTTILTTSGTLLRTIEGVDYPQFTGVTASGNVVTTCPRDLALLSILPSNSSGSDAAVALRTGVDSFACVRGLSYRSSGDGRYPVTLTGMKDGSLTFYVSPDGSGKFAGWIRMTKSQWPNISTTEKSSMPGFYDLPQPGIQCATGSLNRLQIFPHRSRNISRWPMTNVGTAQEAPQPGFSESPDAYLAYIEISGLAVAAPTISWDAGGTDAAWSTAANWSGNVLPGSGDDVLISFGGVYVTSAVGPVGNVTVGNASGNSALNMVSPGSLTATSLKIGAADNANHWPSYFRGDGGNITTTGDFVIGAGGAKIDGIYTWGNITVGGALKIGAGYSDPGDSSLLLRGASSTITSGSLTIGGGVKLIMDFIGGNSIRTLTSTRGVTLESGASIKIVGNSSIVAGNNCRLIDGGAGQLSGTFSNVTFEGFSSSVVPSLVYNTTDGDVWIVISARTISWDGGGTDAAWSTAANWSGDVLPGSADDVVIAGGAYVTSTVGPVGNVVVGNANANGSLNVISGGVLNATSISMGSVSNTPGYPNYFRSERNTGGSGGKITTTGDFIIGANGAKIDGIYDYSSQGITVGGALKIGSGYTASNSTLKFEGGGVYPITSSSLVIGGGVQIVWDFLTGNSLQTLTSTGAVTLESGSSIKIRGNANLTAGNNCRLINGGSAKLGGAFSNVTFEGFSSSVVPSLVYNSTDGDVWLVLSSAGTTFASWSGSSNAATSTTLMSYAIGGAASPTAASEKMVTTLDTSNLSITAIVRVDDTKLSVLGQSTTSLSGSWANLPSNPTGTVSSNQNGVPTGCQRRIFSVSKGSNSKMFLRLVVTLSN